MSFAILSCTGLDKPEGSVAREVAIRLSEEAGALIVCPVVLNRTPTRYKRTIAENRLIVVDGCATQCASKLAAAAGKKPAQKVVVSEFLKKSGREIAPGLHLDTAGLEISQAIVDEIQAAESTELAKPQMPEGAEQSPAEEFEIPSDFIVVVHDKYEFRIPAGGFFFNQNDVWAQVSGTRARVGISDYMQQQLTDITYVDPPAIGAEVEQFGEVGSVESTKAAFELVAPVTGTVLRINQAVEDMPELINEDPYGSWIAELELTAWQEDQMLLIDGAAYAADVERKAAEY